MPKLNALPQVLTLVACPLLFLNSSAFMDLEFTRLFNIHGSPVYGIIRGIGDDDLTRNSALILYWLVFGTYLSVIAHRLTK